MLIACPNCKKQFEITETSAADDKKLRCSSCRCVFRLVRKKPAQAAAQSAPAAAVAAAAPVAPTATPVSPVTPVTPAATAAPAIPVPAPAAPAPPVMLRPAPAAGAAPRAAVAAGGTITLVVANESQAFCDAVVKVLAGEPFEIHVCTDGRQALETVERVVPSLLLLDVALPTMFGFEVCERVKNNPALSGVKIVLIASIYDKTRYKRSPNSLYGADDYLEKHHIPDSLIPMIYRLVSGSAPQPTAPSPSELVLQEQSRSEIRQAEVSQTQAAPAEKPELSEAQVKARRLARIIVSDISLYSQAKVEKGVREGNFYELLGDDIREGELLYRQRVPEAVRETSSYLAEAFEELIAKKRTELNL